MSSIAWYATVPARFTRASKVNVECFNATVRVFRPRMEGSAQIRRSWDAIAGRYQQATRIRLDDVHYGPMIPGERTLRLLGEVGGRRALELGCGGGQNTIVLAKWGADAVGIDISRSQIRFARQLAQREGVHARFFVHAIEALSTLRIRPVHVVLSAFALAYVRDLRRALRDVWRLLVPGGCCVFSDLHPIISQGQADGRGWVVTSYFRRGQRRWYWPRFADGFTAPFFNYHRTVSDIVAAVRDAGFLIDRIFEPMPARLGSRSASSRVPCHAEVLERDRDRWTRVPYTIVFRCVRPPV